MKSTAKTGASKVRRLPDDNLCRTHVLGAFGGVTICLTERPESCPHVSRYGKDYICLRELTRRAVPPNPADGRVGG